MILSNKEVIKKYKNYYNINKAIKNIDHNIYADTPKLDPITLATTKHYNAIITLNTAFYLYNLINKLDINKL